MDNITLQTALNYFSRYDGAETNNAFYNDDHLQKQKKYAGYIGILPPEGHADRASVIEWLERIFTAANLVKSAVNRNVDGTLSREPDFQPIFLQEKSEEYVKEFGKILTNWWNDKEILQRVLRELAKTLLLEKKAFIRPIIPAMYRTNQGTVRTPSDLASGLDVLDFEVLTADKAVIITDPDTGKRHAFAKIVNANTRETEIEYSWTDDNNLTHLRILKDTDLQQWAKVNFSELAKNIEETPFDPETESDPLDLGGNLYLIEASRDLLITETARSLQKSVNYALTNMNKNLNIAGNRQVDWGNVQAPTDEGGNEVPIQVGVTTQNRMVGLGVYATDPQMRDKDGKPILVDYKPVQQFVVDPVAVDTFVKAFEVYRAAFLAEVYQEHLLTNEQSTISGKSRQEARAEFEKSLKATKTAIDPAGRKLLEFSVLFAAALMRSTEFKGLRFDFNCQVTPGAVDTEELVRESKDVDEGKSSVETYLVKKGVEDISAELERIRTAPGYDLTQVKMIAEIYQMFDGQVSIESLAKMSALNDDAQKALIEGFEEKEPDTIVAANGNGVPMKV